MPKAYQAILIPHELTMLEVIDFRVPQRPIPNCDLVNCAKQFVRVLPVITEEQRGRSVGSDRRTAPASGTGLYAVQIQLAAGGIHHHRRMMPKPIGY